MDTLAVFSAIATAIVLEAAPFLLLGAAISAAFEVFLPEGGLSRLTPRNRTAQVAFGLVSGLFLPTCECGVVPVARRLMAKGMPPRAALAFMLSAPVVNPVVLASTFVAFRSDLGMVAGRVALVLLPAAVLAWTLGGLPLESLLRGHKPRSPWSLPMAHDHVHGPDCGCAAQAPATGSRFVRVIVLAGAEFAAMGKYLILGAFAAAAFKTWLPPGLIMATAGNLPLAVAAMMLLAVLLSVCSEADAFVAASFVAFPAAAQLAFVALGPMVDLKLMAMYGGTFGRRPALALVLVPSAMIFVLAVGLGLAWS